MSAFGNSLFGNKPAGNSLFGSTSNNTPLPAQPGGLFGSTTGTNTNTGAIQGSSLFGNTQPQNQQSGTTGAGAGTGAPGGGLFGASNNQQQNQGQPGTIGGGLFGNAGAGTNSNGTTGGGLFGNSNAGGGGTNTGGGLFGNTSTNQPAAGGLFGSTTNTANNQQQPATGNLFGASTSNQSGGGLFGNKTAGTSGGGPFGSTMQSNTAAPGGGIATPSLFGQSNQQQPSTSLFGNQAQQQPTSLFGSLSQQPQQQSQSSSLGSSLLGSSLLGKSTLPGLTGLGASTSNTGLFSSRLPTSAAGQREQDAQSQFLNLQQRIEAIVEAWNPQSPNNRFQHYFYNFVLPEEVQLYCRPANATNEESWQKAVRENPDPSCLIPVLATSFDDLHARVQGQAERAAQHTKALTELQSRISQLSSAHALSTSPRLNKAIAAQTQLTHRLLKLVTHLHLLIPALRSSAIRPEEEALRGALEEMEGEVLSRRGGANAVGGMGRLVARLNEMWALVGALNALKSGNDEQGVSWAVVDEDGLSQIVQILAEEQAGLAHLTKILQKDMKDVAVIYGEGDAQPDESASSPQGRTELMSSFSQTLRASSLG
ncbi:uncharacterized protein STEHIDRAFT_96293 [Stereum hirsutum FP-91666 SS1]|uniref:uncharacterized protein n=1 Tax=Stereum hirsutum (strain FP-91666) TaxID=721885 RepID=UPI000440AB38|nr:uncharacterized protein STEHIDRAFT_96293 [Stereum hirsutum FP-91666 SS1]EIM87243.1 hypothetical protein STEHIDRAFT_96293 [Stereum hirsutum FP-91666 SS1]